MNLIPPALQRLSAHRLPLLLSAVALSTPSIAQNAPTLPPPPEVVAVTPQRTAPGEPASILMNFQGASLSDVLTYLSEAAGFVIVQEAPVSGTVNVVSRQPINPDEAVDLLNSVLIEKGYTAIRNGRILKIVSRKDAHKRDLPVQMGADPERIPRKDELVTQILPLHYGEAAKLVENIRPLLSDTAMISSNDASNAILLTDTLTNIRRIAEIIKALDTSVASISTIEVFQLQFADAKEVADVLTQLFTSGQSRSGQGGGGGGFGGRGGRGFGFGFGPGGPGGPGGGQQAPQSEAKQAASRIVAVADQQSNSVIVSAPEDTIPTIREIVKQIDTNITEVTETRIFRLVHADSVELAEIVNNLYGDQTNQQGRNNNNNNGRRGGQGGFGFPGAPQPQAGAQQSERALLQARVVAVGDPRTNSLVVNASHDSMSQIAEMVGRLDATEAKKQKVYVHSLQHADVDNVAAVLRGMLGQQTGGSVGTVQTGVSRLTERTSTGAAMDSSQVLNGNNNGRSNR